MVDSPALTPSDWKRKAVHAGMGLFALTLRWLDWRAAALLALAALLFNLFVMPRIGRGIYRDAGRRFDIGIVSYAGMVLLLVLLFRDRLEIAAAVWGMMAFGDPAAAIAGKLFAGARLPWNREKTWSGLLANAALGGGAALFFFSFAGAARPVGWAAALGFGALFYAFLESIKAGIDDNIVAALPTGLLLFLILDFGIENWNLFWLAGDWTRTIPFSLLFNVAVALLMWRFKLVSLSGAAAGALVGFLVLVIGGLEAYALLWFFFAAGTAATKLGYRAKAARGLAEKREGRRGAAHVAANCGVPTVLLLATAPPSVAAVSALALHGISAHYLPLVWAGFAGAFGAALADTLGTEIGSLYGKRAFSPLNGSPLPPGTPGAVSAAGLGASAAGAALIAILFGLVFFPARLVWAVGAAGLMGSFAESLAYDLGRRIGFLLDHEFANGFNTFVGAIAAASIGHLLLR